MSKNKLKHLILYKFASPTAINFEPNWTNRNGKKCGASNEWTGVTNTHNWDEHKKSQKHFRLQYTSYDLGS